MKKTIETRNLKIQQRYRLSNNRYKTVPEIKLCGNWLEHSGFCIGDKVVVVNLQNGVIVLKHATQ